MPAPRPGASGLSSSWPITVRHYTDESWSATSSPCQSSNLRSRIGVAPIGVAEQSGQWFQRNGWRRSAVEEPLCRHGQLHDDAAERRVHADDSYIDSRRIPLPASSLNGAINTVLSNNVVTTKITPELTSKLTYRYYDFHNNTPEIYSLIWIDSIRDFGEPPALKQSSPVDRLHQAERWRRFELAADEGMESRRRLRLRAL